MMGFRNKGCVPTTRQSEGKQVKNRFFSKPQLKVLVNDGGGEEHKDLKKKKKLNTNGNTLTVRFLKN